MEVSLATPAPLLLLDPVPTLPSRAWAGEEKVQEEGTLAVLLQGVRFFCTDSQAYLGREMRVAAWAYVFGWCSYTPEPGLLETRGGAHGGGGGWGSQDIGQTVPQGALTLESHYLGSNLSSLPHWLCHLDQVTDPL